jgi:hypothetical protein
MLCAVFMMTLPICGEPAGKGEAEFQLKDKRWYKILSVKGQETTVVGYSAEKIFEGKATVKTIVETTWKVGNTFEVTVETIEIDKKNRVLLSHESDTTVNGKNVEQLRLKKADGGYDMTFVHGKAKKASKIKTDEPFYREFADFLSVSKIADGEAITFSSFSVDALADGKFATTYALKGKKDVIAVGKKVSTREFVSDATKTRIYVDANHVVQLCIIEDSKTESIYYELSSKKGTMGLFRDKKR